MDEIPDWVADRIAELSRGTTTWTAFARYIAQHEEPPVDPLFAEMEDLVSGHAVWDTDRDHDHAIDLAFIALKRGIAIGKGEAA